MIESMNIKEIKEMIKMKMDNPKEYEEFLKGFKEVMMDTIKMAREITEELGDGLE